MNVTQQMCDVNDKLDTIRSLFYNLLTILDEEGDVPSTRRRDAARQELHYAVSDLKNFSELL